MAKATTNRSSISSKNPQCQNQRKNPDCSRRSRRCSVQIRNTPRRSLESWYLMEIVCEATFAPPRRHMPGPKHRLHIPSMGMMATGTATGDTPLPLPAPCTLNEDDDGACHAVGSTSPWPHFAVHAPTTTRLRRVGCRRRRAMRAYSDDYGSRVSGLPANAVPCGAPDDDEDTGCDGWHSARVPVPRTPPTTATKRTATPLQPLRTVWPNDDCL
ncbi:hypothetical protein EDB86DRAFT_1980677 [Lactarius hatsudake]|nr:hypothetical protein EDB86DRAFT_1980677 [Lactarius hatsudake]